jgi:hypothetical protein
VMKEFLAASFTKSWIDGTSLGLAIIAILIALFGISADRGLKLCFCIIIALAWLALIFGLRAYQFFAIYARRIKVLAQVKGEGLYAGKVFVVTENPGYLRDNVLLTLWSPNSGSDQPLSVLRVDKCLPGSDIMAVECAAESAGTDLSSYFDAKNKTSLYVTPLISIIDLTKTLAAGSSLPAIGGVSENAV